MSGYPKDYSNFYDKIEEHLNMGMSINDVARRLKLSAHCVNKCIAERPHLKLIAQANGLKKQNRKLPWES